MIGKISTPRGEHVQPLLYYLFGPGRHEEHTDPHIVAGWRHPASLEPPLRPDGTRDFTKLTGLLLQACGTDWETSVEYVTDRKGHDRRYSLDDSALRAMGYAPRVPFRYGLQETVRWYADHRDWWEALRKGGAEAASGRVS